MQLVMLVHITFTAHSADARRYSISGGMGLKLQLQDPTDFASARGTHPDHTSKTSQEKPSARLRLKVLCESSNAAAHDPNETA